MGYGTCVYAQQDTTNYFGMSNYMFKYLDKSQVTTGLMSDYGIELMDLAGYNGVTLDTTDYVGLQEWRLLYASIYSTQINGTANMEYLDTINSRINNYISKYSLL